MFFKRVDKLGREIYYRENGKRVKKETVKKSKKKVIQIPSFDQRQTKVAISEIKRLSPKVKRAKIPLSEIPELNSSKKVTGTGSILQVEIMQQRVSSRIRGAFENGEKVGFKYKGEIYQIPKDAELEFTTLWESLETKFMNETAPFQDSPNMTVGAVEGLKGILFDFDKLNWFGMLDDEGEEIMEEMPEVLKSIKRIEKYFNSQVKKFVKNAKKKEK